MSLRIGIVDLCTSHPASFIPILREMGCEIAAVWDSAETRDPAFVHSFAKEFNIPRVCKQLDEMIGQVDAVTIHGADWDHHLERIELFVKQGIPVCVDKPVVGCMRDVRRLLELNQQRPGLIFGGSACQFAEEVVSLRSQLREAGPIVSALAIGHADLFSYGIHTIELAQAVLGYDAQAVMCLSERPLGSYLVRFARGFDLNLQLHNPLPGWFLMVNPAEKAVLTSGINLERLYPPFLRRFLEFVKGERTGWSLADALQPITVALAMQQAQKVSGQWLSLAGLPEDEGFDGAAFAQTYRNARDRGVSMYIELKDERWSAHLQQAATR